MIQREDFVNELVGEDLSGVTFVRDYLQLQFNPLPMLNVYTPLTVRSGKEAATFGERGFPNLLLAQIGRFVKSVEFVPDEAPNILFEDGSTISISIRSIDYVGPEAINFFCTNREMIVA